LSKENLNLSDKLINTNHKVSENERYNKLLLDKVMEINEEKRKILQEEANKRGEIVKKCEDFVKEVQEKFNNSLPEREALIKENDLLKKKLEETQVFIKENLETTFKLKNLQIEDEFKKSMNTKMEEIASQAKGYLQENSELKGQLMLYTKKFDEVNLSIGQYNKAFDTLKKEIDKVNRIF